MKQIPSYPDYYADENGNIYRLRSNGRYRPIKQHTATNGKYLYVGVYKDKKKKNVKVHRLVLEAFTGSCPPGLVVRHLNDIGFDNRIDNLAWGTRKENSQEWKDNIIKYKEFFVYVLKNFPHIVERYEATTGN